LNRASLDNIGTVRPLTRQQAITVVGEGETEKEEVVVVMEEEDDHNRWYDDEEEELDMEEDTDEKRGGAKNTSTNSYVAPTRTIVPPPFLGTSPLTMVSAFVLSPKTHYC
jgi:hypothetical protein